MPFGITATLGLDGRGFKAGMREAQGITNKWAGSLKGQIAGAFTAAAILRATTDVVKFASVVDDASKKINFSRKAVQEWMHALKLSGGEIRDLEAAVKGLSISRLDALKNPEGDNAAIFKALGITKEALANNPLEETMKQIARSFETLDFGGAEGGMVTKILGKGGMAMLATFKEGIDDVMEDLREMGGIMEDDVVRNLDQAGDAVDILGTKLRKMASDALNPVVKLFKQVNGEYNQLGREINAFWQSQKLAGETGENWVDVYNQILRAMEADQNTKVAERVDRARKRGEGREKRDPKLPEADAKIAKVVEATGVAPSSDSLSRIGGFVGGGGGTVNRLTAIEKELQKLNAQVKSGLVLKPE